MFFLAGIGILRVLWLPFFDSSSTLLTLGDISYIPYWIVMYPLRLLSEEGIGHWVTYGKAVANLAVGVGLLIFCVGTFTWLYDKLEKRKVFDFWVYRYSRHPQYLGFILWSYGILLLTTLTAVAMGGYKPYPSFPWLISTILIICVAIAEEITMIKQADDGYLQYRRRSPFMLPLPRFVAKLITAPNRVLLKKDFPESGRKVIYTFVIYSTLLILLSLLVQELNLFSGILLRR
jgi:protein-S-isoprenylcysteine O-methyltransferase Ste14